MQMNITRPAIMTATIIAVLAAQSEFAISKPVLAIKTKPAPTTTTPRPTTSQQSVTPNKPKSGIATH
jgi:hypothetical protein